MTLPSCLLTYTLLGCSHSPDEAMMLTLLERINPDHGTTFSLEVAVLQLHQRYLL